MPKAPSQTRIINAAAALLGSTEKVQSIDDTGRVASAAREHWDDILLMLVAEHPWNRFIERTTLNEAGIAPGHGYARRFALPADCLRWLPPGPSDRESNFSGEAEGGFILTDAEAPLRIRFISNAKADDVATWAPHFVTTMKDHLASAMAEALTGSQSIQRTMEDRARDSLARAKRRDGLESNGRQRTPVHSRSRWSRAKFAGGCDAVPPYRGC